MLKYFYIRNNIYLNRLTKEELEFLKRKLINRDYSFDESVFNFINSTYKKLIFEVINENPSIIAKISYGPVSDTYFALNNSLVLGIRYDEFNIGTMTEDEWFFNRIKQKELIETLIQNLETKISNDLKIPCKVIEYDNFSVNLLNNQKTI